VHMVKVGMVDPLKVIRTALVDAARYFIQPLLCSRTRWEIMDNVLLAFFRT
jgi:hypothetical protein